MWGNLEVFLDFFFLIVVSLCFDFFWCVLYVALTVQAFQIIRCHILVKQGDGLKSSPSKNGFRQHCTQDWIHPEHL